MSDAATDIGPSGTDDWIFMDLNGCARCDHAGHANLVFKRFESPPLGDGRLPIASHWASCPITGDPILMVFV